MPDIKIENIVVSTQIAEELDLSRLAENIADSKYKPDEFPGLILHFKEPKTAVLLFSSGKLICTGARDMDEVKDALQKITGKIKDVGLSIIKKSEMKTQNIVASADLKKELHLASVAESLMSENVEYEPEQFPGLAYRMDELGVVLLIFSSGKLVCTGAKKMEDVSTAIEAITDKLSSIGVL